MDYETFLERTREILSLESPEEAETTVEATLATLGERLSTPQRTRLAAQLPRGAKRMLHRYQRTRRFSLEDFYRRVSSRADVSYRAAVSRARAVISVLKEAISEGARQQLLDELPDEYRELFEDEAIEPRSTSS